VTGKEKLSAVNFSDLFGLLRDSKYSSFKGPWK
jgi:hypothetical protein